MKPLETTASIKKRLGRGLGSLISTPVKIDLKPDHSSQTLPGPSSATSSHQVTHRITGGSSGGGDEFASNQGGIMLAVGQIFPNPKQPRKTFDEHSIAVLADSIKVAGLMQPVLVRASSSNQTTTDGKPVFELIAGERRWRAAQKAGLDAIPAIVRDVDDRTSSELALIENIQREDLNPIDRAEAFAQLILEFGLTHEDLATQVGLDRSTITNHLRLNDLDDSIKNLVRSNKLTMGHARALLAIANISNRTRLAQQAVAEGWSVREIERRSAAAGSLGAKKKVPDVGGGSGVPRRGTANTQDLERRLSEYLGTRVHVEPGEKKGTGRLVIEFFSLDQFDGLMDRMGFGVDESR